MMIGSKRLRLVDLDDEQFACLRDYNRRAEAHGMLDDLRDRCGYDVDALRATLPPLGRFRAIVETYTFMTEVDTGGGCRAVQIPCPDGTHLLLTDQALGLPEDDARIVLVSRYRGGERVAEALAVPVENLEQVIDSALNRSNRSHGRFRAVIEKYPEAKEITTGGNCTAIEIPCGDGTYLLFTDSRDAMSPEDDAETVCVSRHNDQGPVAITSDLRGDKDGTVEVPAEDLEGVIDAAMARARPAAREPSRPAALERRPPRSRPPDLER
jgi:hypothetical protein